MKKIFLGGTCNNSTWREKLIPMLEKNHVKYFNPVVPDWTEEAMEREIYERENCDYCLYVITPKMKGCYSIAETVDDSNKRPEKTLFCVIDHDTDDMGNLLTFDSHEIKALDQVSKMIERNGAKSFCSLFDIAEYVADK